MTIRELSKKASITDDGCILIGKHISCDGTDLGRSAGFISHAHEDHLNEFERALGYYDRIFTSPETRDLLIAKKGNWLLKRTNLVGNPYGKTFT